MSTARVGDDRGGDVPARGGVPPEAVDQVRDGVVSGRFAPLSEHPAAPADAREAFTSGLAQMCLSMSVPAFVAAVLCTWPTRDGDRHEAARVRTR